jgi:hypothetical protein
VIGLEHVRILSVQSSLVGLSDRFVDGCRDFITLLQSLFKVELVFEVADRLSLAVSGVEYNHLREHIRSLTDVHVLLGFLGIITHVDVKHFSIVVENRLHHLVKGLKYFLM